MEELPIEDGCVRPGIRDLTEGEWPEEEEDEEAAIAPVVYELIF